MERHKERRAMAHRWDDSLRMLCSNFAGTARELLDLSRRLGRSADEDTRRQLDEVQLPLRALTYQIRLLGDREVQLAAQLMLYHGYAVRMIVGEQKPDDRGGVPGTSGDSLQSRPHELL